MSYLKEKFQMSLSAQNVLVLMIVVLGVIVGKMLEYSIFNLAKLKMKQAEILYHSGVTLITDLPYDYKLTSSQAYQVQADRDGSVIINKNNLRSFTDQLEYPLHFLDFETTNMAVPEFELQRPYQQIPFQYSVHIKNSKTSDAIHHEFLAESKCKDPRLDFIKSLIRDCGKRKYSGL